MKKITRTRYYPSGEDAMEATGLQYGLWLLKRFGYDPEEENDDAVNELILEMITEEVTQNMRTNKWRLKKDAIGWFYEGWDLPPDQK